MLIRRLNRFRNHSKPDILISARYLRQQNLVPWEFKQLLEFAQRKKIPLHTPWKQMSDRHKRMVFEGVDGDDYFSVEEFFEHLQRKTYKARLLISLEGTAAVDRFLEDGRRKGASEEFTLGLAEILSELRDPEVVKRLRKQAGKGKGNELLFTLRAARRIEDPKLDKVLLRVLNGKDERAQREVLETIALRKDHDFLPALEQLRAAAQDPGLLTAVLQVIGTLRPLDRDFWAEAAGYADDDERRLRNWALAFLGDTRDERYVPVLITALGHDSWSTRLVAARGLEQMAQEEGVGALCARMPHEAGRVARDMAEILFRLTGRLFGANGRMWAAWPA